MRLPRIDQAIEVCQEHLTKSGAAGTEIEAFLTRYLTILICATFEEEIESILVKRASKANDPYLEAFVRSCLHAIFRSIKTSEIAGLLNRFGPEYKEKFQKKLSNTSPETYFNNIVINRHYTAHESGSNMTFRELVHAYEESHKVLDVLSEVVFE